MTFQPGDRVAWILDPDDPTDEDDGWRGTVREPTQEELDYVATWSSSARVSIRDHVVVVGDGDDFNDGAWCDPEQLRPDPDDPEVAHPE